MSYEFAQTVTYSLKNLKPEDISWDGQVLVIKAGTDTTFAIHLDEFLLQEIVKRCHSEVIGRMND